MRRFAGADVASAADVQALADRTLAEFGAVHVLCNNAGVGGGSDLARISPGSR